MTMTWVICGAGKGVGKTHLAHELCALLPRAVYAKHGHGKRDPRKPANYFTNAKALASFLDECSGSYDHVVVESNALARRGEGDVIIFLSGAQGQTDVRADARKLRGNAHVKIGASATKREWRAALKGKVPDRRLREKVCAAFEKQRRHLAGGLAVRSKVWFVRDGKHVFGPGLARLLRGVDRHGTLRQATRVEKISYRHAWEEIGAAEKRLGKRLILRQAGGAGGGRSELSPEGRRLMELFDRVNAEVAGFADARFARYVDGEEHGKHGHDDPA